MTVPGWMGAEVVAGERPASASYGPFAPSANYHTASVDRTVETDTSYLLAVYEPDNRSDPAGVAIGPFLGVVLGGSVLLRERLPRSPIRAALAVAAVACVASEINTLVQMGVALSRTGPAAGALVTAVFVLGPAVLLAGAAVPERLIR